MLSSRRIVFLSPKIIFIIIMQSRLRDWVYKLFVRTKTNLWWGGFKIGGEEEEEDVEQKKNSPDFKPSEVGISGLYAVH